MKALIVTNCATSAYTESLKLIRPDWDIRGVNVVVAHKWLTTEPNEEFLRFFDAVDVLITGSLDLRPSPKQALTIPIPGFFFRGLHPDMFHIINGPRCVLDPGGIEWSRIAVVAYMAGKSQEQTLKLFNRDVYQAIGYLNLYDDSRIETETLFRQFGIELSDLFEGWKNTGNFMYTYNHPKVFVLTDILRRAITGPIVSASESAGLAIHLKSVADELADSIIWPVYPEIGALHQIEEPMVWRKTRANNFEEMPLNIFVSRTFAHLEAYPSLSSDLIPGYERVAKTIS